MTINTLLLNAQSAANTVGVKDLLQTAPQNLTFYVTFSSGSTAGVVRLYTLASAGDTATLGQQIGSDITLASLTAGRTYAYEVTQRAYAAVAAVISTAVTGGGSPSVTVCLVAN